MACRANYVIAGYIVLSVFSIVLTYGVAVGCGHVTPNAPYLSYLGDLPIESTIFTQFFVIVAAVFMLVVQIQYVWMRFLLEKTEASRESLVVNSVSVYVGYIAAFGLFVLSCFQESHAYYVHHFGEFLYLFGSVLYFALLTYISRTVKSFLTKLRWIFNSLMIGCYVCYVVAYVIAVWQFGKPWEERYHWGWNDGGFIAKTVSSAAQWILLSMFHFYLLTFCQNFRGIVITKTRIIVMNEERRVSL